MKMDEKVKEVLKAAGEKLQRLRFYLVKQYKRQRRDLKRLLNPKNGSTWQGKALYRWNMAELVDFFQKEVGVENKVLIQYDSAEWEPG